MHSSNLPRIIIAVLVSAFLAGLIGCQGMEDIKGVDRSVFFPSLRATLDFDREARKEGSSERPIRVQAEFDYVYVSGRSSQDLRSSTFIDFRGTKIDGPAHVKADYMIESFSAAGKVGGEILPHLRLEGILGGACYLFHMGLEAETASVHGGTFTVGPMVGLQLALEPFSGLTLYGRTTSGFGLFGRIPSDVISVEAGLSIRLARSLSLAGGWRKLRYRENDLYEQDSTVDLSSSGPMAGIHLSF